MRGSILLIDSRPSPSDVDLWRENGLTVYHSHDLTHARQHFQHRAADVIVVVAAADEASPIVAAMRTLADGATSIIVLSEPGERDAARQAGADAFLATSPAPRAELLYEIHRALILRRSGRRLSWS